MHILVFSVIETRMATPTVFKTAILEAVELVV